MRKIESYIPLFEQIARSQIKRKSSPYLLETEDIVSMCYFGYAEANRKYPQDMDDTEFRKVCYTVIVRRLIDSYRMLYWADRESFDIIKINKKEDKIPVFYQEHPKIPLESLGIDTTEHILDPDLLNVLFGGLAKDTKQIMMFKYIDGTSLAKLDKVWKSSPNGSHQYASRKHARYIGIVKKRAENYLKKLYEDQN
jgi:hypothetical protein